MRPAGLLRFSFGNCSTLKLRGGTKHHLFLVEIRFPMGPIMSCYLVGKGAKYLMFQSPNILASDNRPSQFSKLSLELSSQYMWWEMDIPFLVVVAVVDITFCLVSLPCFISHCYILFHSIRDSSVLLQLLYCSSIESVKQSNNFTNLHSFC